MPRVLIADPLEESGLALLRAAGLEVVALAPAERSRLAEQVAAVDALIVRSATRVTRELLESAPRLRVIGRAGVGVDNIDVEAAAERGVRVVNAPTANVLAATEHTFALLLALARRIPAADAAMKRGAWERGPFRGCELAGKRLGIVGYGRIGSRVGTRARAFEMTVSACDPKLDPAVAARAGIVCVPLEELLGTSDVVTLHTPLDATTRGMLGATRIARMKTGALLVNCARGGLVDERALLAALDSGALAGAALDVWADEPTPLPELVRHERVVATPHLGAQTLEAQERVAVETAERLVAALAESAASGD